MKARTLVHGKVAVALKNNAPKKERKIQNGIRPQTYCNKCTWHESCKEGEEREQDLLSMTEELQTQGSKDEFDRTALVSGLRGFKKIRDEEEKHLQKVKQVEELLWVQQE